MKLSRFPRFAHPRSFVEPLAAVSFLLLVTACSGDPTEGGGTGDPASSPLADACGGGRRMADVVGPATWLDPKDNMSKSCSYPLNRPVSLAGLRVSAVDHFDETGDGSAGNYYGQDACATLGPFQGMTIYAPSFSPPDLRLFPGDVVDLLGNLQEFPGPASAGAFPNCRTLPEIGGTLTFRFELGPTLTPKTIPLSDLKSYETARQWLGMLVKVDNIIIAGDPYESKGRYCGAINVGGGIPQSDVPSICNELFDLKNLGPPIPDGAKFKSVTGVVTYFYTFKISPRSADDFEI